MQERILSTLAESLGIYSELAENMPAQLESFAKILINGLMNDQRIFCCGNGAAFANASSFVTKLVNRYEFERPPFPAILLGDMASASAISADSNFSDTCARPLQALARPHDILLVLSASGSALNMTHAAKTMQSMDGIVLAITGADGGELSRLMRPDIDLALQIPSTHSARIHEAQLFILNCCCDLIDREIFGAHYA